MSSPNAQQVMRLRNATGRSVMKCKRMLELVPDDDLESYLTHYETGHRIGFQDPIEADPAYSEILSKAEKEAIESVKQESISVHAFWSAKKRILKNRYDIEWKSPQELTPDMCID